MARAAAPARSLTARQRTELAQLTRLPSTPQNVVLRAKIVLGAADGMANKTLDERWLNGWRPHEEVLLWRNRYAEEGLAGILEDRSRPGRPKEISQGEEAEIVEATRSTKPKNATHWTVRTMASDQGVSPASMHRIWRPYGLKRHRVETFKFSNDPQFGHKIGDIVGLYLNPPDKAPKHDVIATEQRSPGESLRRSCSP